MECSKLQLVEGFESIESESRESYSYFSIIRCWYPNPKLNQCGCVSPYLLYRPMSSSMLRPLHQPQVILLRRQRHHPHFVYYSNSQVISIRTFLNRIQLNYPLVWAMNKMEMRINLESVAPWLLNGASLCIGAACRRSQVAVFKCRKRFMSRHSPRSPWN